VLMLDFLVLLVGDLHYSIESTFVSDSKVVAISFALISPLRTWNHRVASLLACYLDLYYARIQQDESLLYPSLAKTT